MPTAAIIVPVIAAHATVPPVRGQERTSGDDHAGGSGRDARTVTSCGCC